MDTKRDSAFSMKRLAKSFGYAINGIRIIISSEKNAQIHVVATIVAVIMGFYFNISQSEWLAVTIVVGAMFGAEGLNTAIEKLADFVKPEIDERIRIVKDVASGAVLWVTFSAIIVGLIVFLPKLYYFIISMV
jgi:diacylglycerol kinase (ATP)